jgi:hypothetical protein
VLRQPRARGSRASWGKEGGDRGEHVGLLTLDGERREDGRWWRVAAAGDSPRWWWRSRGSPTTGRCSTNVARRRGAHVGVGFVSRRPDATN